MKKLLKILIIISTIIIDLSLIILSIVAFSVSKVFGIFITIAVFYIIILSIVILINCIDFGEE